MRLDKKNDVMTQDEIFDCYRKAGEIHRKLIEESREKVKKGVGVYEFADYIDKRTIELGGLSAFPVNISLNEEAAHSTASFEDERKFEKDVIKIDIGVHVKGYIADGAITIDLSGKYSDLVKASEEALNAAIDVVKAGVSTTKIGETIEDTIQGLGFEPVRNLMGHGVDKYIAHAEPSIPNCRMKYDATLVENQVIAIEPFATDGEGFVVDGKFCEIYSQVKNKPTRIKFIREILEHIKTYNGLPFAARWLPQNKTDMALNQLLKEGTITAYPVLIEASGGIVSQAEHTLIVTEDGCEVTTR